MTDTPAYLAAQGSPGHPKAPSHVGLPVDSYVGEFKPIFLVVLNCKHLVKLAKLWKWSLHGQSVTISVDIYGMRISVNMFRHWVTLRGYREISNRQPVSTDTL